MNIAILFGKKNSKGFKNKNIRKVLSKRMFLYPVEAAKKVKEINKIYVSSDSDYILDETKKRGCEIIKRPKSLCTAEALLEDAIRHAVKIILKKHKNVSNIIILLCNSICINYKDIIKGLKYLKNNRKLQTVTTISKFNMFSPVRAKKINGSNLSNYIPNKVLSKFTKLSCDKGKSTDTYFCTNSFTISRSQIFKNMKKNPMPFNWMGTRVRYIEQEFCLGDIDYEWQIPATEMWLKKNL